MINGLPEAPTVGSEAATTLHPKLASWFRRKRWQPFPFQEEAWRAFAEGAHGLVNAPTGTGKTYSVWMGPLSLWLNENPDFGKWPKKETAPPFVLWITPLRALANDTAKSLLAPVSALKLPWSVELRTGDTSAARKLRHRQKLPTALVTTPESLSVLLSYDTTRELLKTLRCVVVDEWHELIGTKRGTQTELALARLRTWVPELRTWGLSATLGNLEQAMQVLAGISGGERRLIRGPRDKQISIETLLPESIERFPWSGHIGLRLLPAVVRTVGQARSTLVFTNTRAQAELWFQHITAANVPWAKKVALHHGSLDRQVREAVEQALRMGAVRCVVCTSSLDLGVDFPAVDQVIQIGSPKGVARLLQRAGRSGHQPGVVSRIYCVPTNAFELVEYSAARTAANSGHIEKREPLDRPIDVLVQHLVTLAVGSGFEEEELLREVRQTFSYQNLTDGEWQWAMEFVTRGGPALRAYPQYQKVVRHGERFGAANDKIAKLHRMNIGTITGDMAITLKLQGGGVLGTVEENFLAKIPAHGRFIFGGRVLQLVRIKDMTATVRLASDASGILPNWGGSRMPITSQLGVAVREQLDAARRGVYDGPEMEMVRPVLQIQASWSRIPAPDELLIEFVRSREGYHVFIFPFEGHFVHEGLGSLLAWRIARLMPRTIGVTMNDYGIELLSAQPIDLGLDEGAWKKILSPDRLLDDLLEGINATELSRRQFREVARVAGLVFGGYPGAMKGVRQMQSSTGLLYEVFVRHDPDNLLLDQARREVLDRQLEVVRLRAALERLTSAKLLMQPLVRFTPLAFPLWASRLSSATAHLTTESIADRIRRMVLHLEDAADETEAARA